MNILDVSPKDGSAYGWEYVGECRLGLHMLLKHPIIRRVYLDIKGAKITLVIFLLQDDYFQSCKVNRQFGTLEAGIFCFHFDCSFFLSFLPAVGNLALAAGILGTD